MSQRSHWSTVIFLSCVAVTGCSSDSKSDAPGDTGNGDTSMQGQPNGNSSAPSGNTSGNPAAGSGGSSGSSNMSSGGTQMNNPGAAGKDSANNGGGAGAAMMPDNTSVIPKDPKTPFNKLPANCVGFKVEGLKNSPGGSTLPNTCAPFHGLNNPYAIRCVDADPTTRRAGSATSTASCRPAELGTQIHVGPKLRRSGGGQFELQPGKSQHQLLHQLAERSRCLLLPHQLAHARRLAPHDHLAASDRTAQMVGRPGEAARHGLRLLGFGGAQRTDADRP